MRILLVVTGLGVGGAERQVVDLADGFVRRGHVVAIAYMTGQALVCPASGAVRLIALGMMRTGLSVMRGAYRLRRLIREFLPDVVHSHMVHANLLCRLLRLTVSIPRLVCTAHNTNEGGRLRMLAYRQTHRLAHVSTNVSGDAVASFERLGAIPKGGMRVVTNGIDVARYRPDLAERTALREAEGIGAGDVVVIAIGRLSPAKDYPNLLQAWNRMGAEHGKARLWIVGEGPARPELQALAALLERPKSVRFLGLRADIPALLNAADVYVLSSAWEGFPLVVGEAMASGKTVVATDCGGVREMLGDCGYLVPSRDPMALASALQLALSMPSEARARLESRSRERIVAHFSIERRLDDWLAIYQGVGQ